MLSSPIEEIKNRLDITEVVREYLQLQKAGANFRALCPFHGEKSPSFFVSPARQTWHCFGCGLGGDAFRFIMQIEGVEFGEALRLLAQKAGVELPKRDPQFLKLEGERKHLFDLLELATKFFETQLQSSPAGKEAASYLQGRGITEESMKKWRIGYAPDSARGLYDFLLKQQYTTDEIRKAGLLVYSEGSPFDRFRGRIMFPVANGSGQVTGFGGRIFGKKEGEDLAKYLNTSNTPVYDKSRILYGLDKAKLEIRKNKYAFLVEGYLDAIMVSQAGHGNVVAVSGTALTDFHLKILKRYSDILYAAFDRDSAGEKATKRSIDLALAEGFQVKVVVMPPGKDPADVVKEDPQAWAGNVENARSVFDFYFDVAFSNFDKNTAEGKKEIAKSLLPVISRLPNAIEQAHWIQRLSKELGVDEKDIRVELEKEEREETKRERQVVKAQESQKTRRELLEERILALGLREFPLLKKISEEEVSLCSSAFQELLFALQKLEQFDWKTLDTLFPDETCQYLKRISLESEVFEDEDLDIPSEFQVCRKELRQLHLRSRLEELAREIRGASQDAQRLKALMEEFQSTSQQLHLPQ